MRGGIQLLCENVRRLEFARNVIDDQLVALQEVSHIVVLDIDVLCLVVMDWIVGYCDCAGVVAEDTRGLMMDEEFCKKLGSCISFS